ncbi:MAG: hypothetical protein J6A75_06165 [Lachnospiraceae bacterium]|nr:hypothetical protein [Lachnospiraceae bacterium]
MWTDDFGRVLDLLNILKDTSGKLPRMAILGETAMEGGLSRRIRYQYLS